MYLPTGHDTHAEMLVTAEYLPATQGVHDPDPAVLYAPSPQSAHGTAPPGENRPGGQAALQADCPASTTNVPAEQLTQADAPVAAAMDPAGHAVHTGVPVDGAYFPRGHFKHTVVPEVDA